MRGEWLVLLVGAVAVQLAVVPDARAYIEPGSSGVIFQMIVASLLGAVVAVKAFYRRAVSRARRLFSARQPDDES